MEGLIERLTRADAVQPAARQVSAASSNDRQPDAAAAAPQQAGDGAPSKAPAAPQARPFYIANPSYDAAVPASPDMIPDQTATATPQKVQWTSPNGLTTTGVMNPFGLTKNIPSIGFYG